MMEAQEMKWENSRWMPTIFFYMFWKSVSFNSTCRSAFHKAVMNGIGVRLAIAIRLLQRSILS